MTRRTLSSAQHTIALLACGLSALPLWGCASPHPPPASPSSETEGAQKAGQDSGSGAREGAPHTGGFDSHLSPRLIGPATKSLEEEAKENAIVRESLSPPEKRIPPVVIGPPNTFSESEFRQGESPAFLTASYVVTQHQAAELKVLGAVGYVLYPPPDGTPAEINDSINRIKYLCYSLSKYFPTPDPEHFSNIEPVLLRGLAWPVSSKYYEDMSEYARYPTNQQELDCGSIAKNYDYRKYTEMESLVIKYNPACIE